MQEVSIGKQLKAARLKAGMTQTQLSKAAGVSQAAIAFYENDVKSPVANKLAAMAKALGVPMEALVETNKAPTEPGSEGDNRLHGNSTAAQIQRLVLQLDREAQKILLMQAKRMLPTDPDHKKRSTKAA